MLGNVLRIAPKSQPILDHHRHHYKPPNNRTVPTTSTTNYCEFRFSSPRNNFHELCNSASLLLFTLISLIITAVSTAITILLKCHYRDNNPAAHQALDTATSLAHQSLHSAISNTIDPTIVTTVSTLAHQITTAALDDNSPTSPSSTTDNSPTTPSTGDNSNTTTFYPLPPPRFR